MEQFKVLILFSGSASALQYLFKNDSNYKCTYTVVGAVSNKKGTKGEMFCKEHTIPFQEINSKAFCLRHGYTGILRDMPSDIRESYYVELLDIVKKKYAPDLILLSGFMLKITKPLLGSCPIINVHPADLRIKNDDGRPKYTGDDAVTMAINEGETSTASTIHVVEEEVDCGRIICVSNPLFVEGGTAPRDHQEKMKICCDGPAYRKALKLITTGEFSF